MEILEILRKSKCVEVCIIVIIMDTIFGILRAVKQKKLNSSIGIDGIIRKAGMLIALFFFYLIDYIINLNLIGFIPKEVLELLKFEKIGIGSLFGILFIIFEILSTIKNMAQCKLPIPKKLENYLLKILNEFTEEIK